MEVVGLIVASIFFLAGIAGTFVPVLPGAPLIWSGMLIYGFITGFEKLDLFFFIIQGGLALVMLVIDYAATAMGSRCFGASKAAIAGAALGFLIGLYFFPFGLLIGPFLGAVLLELIFSRQADRALRAGLGAALGFWAGFAVKLLLAGAMVAWFFVKVL
jgi:uncharacterized protein YqgC (DUF456 family)